MIVKNFQSNVTLYIEAIVIISQEKNQKLEKVKEEEIRVNEPLKFEISRFIKWNINSMNLTKCLSI